ncbi:MAG: class I SAM-dependent DNA methyltransferase [Bacteroidales bacterium]|nr:class I SAM-dependent DNA methyltransferase [Bacteroidales bacterium]
MANKTKSFSLVQATDALEQLGQRGTSAHEFIFELLRIFAGYGDGQIRRVKEGSGNLAKDKETVLIKNLVAYRPAPVNTINGDCSKLYDIVNAMRDDAKITKQSPRLYITSNGVHVVVYDPKDNDWDENSIELLWKDFEFFTPLAGIEKIQFSEEAEADVKSAELMAKLYDDIRRYNDIRDPQTVHALNVFMSRLLFCFFAEDTGLFPEENLFTNTLRTHTKEDGSDLGEFIDRAFFAMSTNVKDALDTLPDLYKVFPYVNGGLFKERFPIPVLSRRARTLIINCGEYNWREINPDIFGSMIQAVITPEQRAGLGMHYTSVPNIEKVICPLFFDELEEEFEAARSEAREKIANNIHSERATQRLRNLLGRMSRIKFFDPACGSGNFLIISYKRLRELEIRIWKELRELSKTAFLPVPSISLTQFYGIELDGYACDTATLSLWLAEHQMNVKFKEELYVLPETLPLKPSGHIVCGNACRIDWNTVCPHTSEDEVYIMGNPPYLGSSLQSLEQKEDMRIAVGEFCKGYKKLDYIATWFFKASIFCRDSKSSFAFVTTNSITQGEQVPILWPVLFSTGILIKFAYPSFKWSNNAKHNAGVTVSVIGLSVNPHTRFLYKNGMKQVVNMINPYLVASDSKIVEPSKLPICKVPLMTKGSIPVDGGSLVLDKYEAENILQEYPYADMFIKKYIGSDELLNSDFRYCIWVEDEFASAAYEIPPFFIRFENCRQMRLNSTKQATIQDAQYPYRFSERRFLDTECIIVPSHSSENRAYVPIGYSSEESVISNAAFAVYDAEKWLFTILMSKMHNIWIRAVAGALETRIRYSNTLCYNTFPFPKLTIAQKEELERLAQNILNIRDENFDMTLGEMYNPETMPEELREAHHQLDLAVERIYRPEPFTSDEERLEHLFKLYAKMTKK